MSEGFAKSIGGATLVLNWLTGVYALGRTDAAIGVGVLPLQVTVDTFQDRCGSLPIVEPTKIDSTNR